MILDFTVTNFRSIRERQTFSLVAEGASNHLSDNMVPMEAGKFRVLKAAGIYGANASGKSNLLLAFHALEYIAIGSGDLKEGDPIPCYEPYLLSNTTKEAPIFFEIEFIVNSKDRYTYSVSYNSNKILSESLDYYPSRIKANLFNRKEGQSWDDITFGSHYKGGKKKIAFFENNSYLSKAGNSADSPQVVRDIFQFFRRKFYCLGVKDEIDFFDWKKSKKLVASVSEIMSKIDTGITGISFKDEDVSHIKFAIDIPEELKERIINSRKTKPIFIHESDEIPNTEFSEDMESEGTVKFFKVLPLLISIFHVGGVLIVDELDSSMHPHLAELVIKLINDPKVNINNAQLIFSTHNINLMSSNLLRRDQIWITEKLHGSTSFSSIDDFDKSSVKPDSPFGKWYDDGRFGAIPKINIREISDALVRGIS